VQPVKAKWQQSGLVLVCEKCYKERIPDEAPEIAEQIGDFSLRDWLKSALKEHGEWGPIRVIGTSCLDVCSREKVTVVLNPQGGKAQVLILDPLAERDDLYRLIVETMGQEAQTP
jgi:predicted metal-binding protein